MNTDMWNWNILFSEKPYMATAWQQGVRYNLSEVSYLFSFDQTLTYCIMIFEKFLFLIWNCLFPYTRNLEVFTTTLSDSLYVIYF